MRATLTRTYRGSDNTLGQLDFGDQSIFTLELPWVNNQVGVSCIPDGIYPVTKHVSPKFGRCYWIHNVIGRSEILIHPANYTRQLRGCIATGTEQGYLDQDDEIDNIHSKNALKLLLAFDLTELEIKSI